MSNSRITNLLLLTIISTGIVLRFWNFWNMPFTFDELSAMSRTVFGSFAEMIRVGVVEKDSHPAGIQTFLYFWVRMFGDSEMVVKAPFLIAGVVSIWLAYQIGKLWFNPTDGILTAAYMSSLQFFILYSQVARPYASGLVFTLAMTLFWSRYFFKGNKTKDLFWFVLFGSLSAYNHYFSLLFVATVGLTGLFLVNKKTYKAYLLSGVAMIILYIPHLSIFLAQAEKGSIGGWLGAPGEGFIWEFFRWMFHYSSISIGLFMVIIVLGLVLFRQAQGEMLNVQKKRLILFLWLLPAPIFGYIYSYTVEPILQFSLLIFTAPYLFILVFSFIREFKPLQLAIPVILILLVNTLTLVQKREHYSVFYKQPFEQVVKEAIRLDANYPGNVFIINNYIPYYSEYYFQKYQVTLPYFTIRNKELTRDQFDSVVSGVKQNLVITSGMPPDYFFQVKSHFPHWIGYDHGFTFEQYTFAKEIPVAETELKTDNLSTLDFIGDTATWTYDRNIIVYDSISETPVLPMQNREWGPLIELPLKSITQYGYDFIDVKVMTNSFESTTKVIVVAEIKDGEENIAWRGKSFYLSGEGPIQQIHGTTFDLQLMLNNRLNLKNRMLRIYLWNPELSGFGITRIEIDRRYANPYRYALYSDFTIE